ncbi:MAG: PSD1 and planctomycete cytochrome C domain-containing protein [Planctomycetaceae bacterium]
MPRSFPARLHLAVFALVAVGSFLACGWPSAGVRAADEATVVKNESPSQASVEFFQQKVKPLLVAHCLDCHGGKSVKGDFDLATREKLLESGFVEPTADASYLIELIEHRADPKMPFQKPRLAAAEIAILRQWIDLGAPYDEPLAKERVGTGREPAEMVVTDEDRQYWAFLPWSESTPPPLASDDWSRTPIDQFVLAKQRDLGLTPNGAAERRVLIRRAYFDLLGLPPTPEEVDAFVSNEDPQAWSQLLDRLLASDHYGERWARHWMDIARFAESHGYEQDYDRPHAYHFRDFLIKAFNADMPFNQFTRWQLAGDEIAPDDPLALMATGFLGAGAFPTQLTEAEFESARYDELDDMVGTTGVAFLGLSVACARCHDHKFDPIPSRDYYRMAAAFATTIRSEIDLDLHPEANARRREEFAENRGQLVAALQDYEQTELSIEFDHWLAKYDPVNRTIVSVETEAGATGADPSTVVGPSELGPWSVLEGTVTSTGTKTYDRQSDGSWLATGKAPDTEVVTFIGLFPPGTTRAIRIEALTEDSLPKLGPGRAPNGNFALGNLQVIVSTSGAERLLPLSAARATHQQNDGSLSAAASIDSDPVSGWAVDGAIGKSQAAVFDLAKPLESDGTTPVKVVLNFAHPNKQHSIGRLRLSATDMASPAATLDEIGPDSGVLTALTMLKQAHNKPATDDAQLTAARAKALAWFRTEAPKSCRLQQALADLDKAGNGVELSKVMVCSEGFPHMTHHADGRGFPHFYPQVHRLKRGDVHQKQEVVDAGYLQVLMQPGRKSEDWKQSPPADWTRTSYRRTALADWMTDVDHGAGVLLARVIVNRLWQHHFGTGLVATPNDFGFSGEKPTHPELLDWLARDLVSHGWQLKRLHKLIMTSAVYLQNGDFDEARAVLDRENRFLWRRAPQRLEAESIRDAMLATSGLLDPTMFGPGTLDQYMVRRSVYFFIKRSQLIPTMMLFDWPEHLVSIGQRATTTVAPQALMFLNSPQGRNYAAAFATRLKSRDDRAAIQQAYRIAFGRLPTEDELTLSTSFLQQGQAMRDASNAGNARLASRTDFCQALLGMNEFLYVE